MPPGIYGLDKPPRACYTRGMSEKYITVAQAAKLLGCPRSFLKSEIARGRIFTYRRGLRNKLKRESILMYRQETEGSQVWKDFLEAGYTPDLTV